MKSHNPTQHHNIIKLSFVYYCFDSDTQCSKDIQTQSTSQYLPHSHTHTHIHTLMEEAAMQGANCTSGAIWGSVSCSRTLRHAAQPSPGELGFKPAARLIYSLAELQLPQISHSKFPECLRITFSKNILKIFCDNLLKMFSENIA